MNGVVLISKTVTVISKFHNFYSLEKLSFMIFSNCYQANLGGDCRALENHQGSQ